MFYPTFLYFNGDFQYEYNEKSFDIESFKKFLKGGYEESYKEEIPLTPQKWRNFIKYIGKIVKRAYEVICVDGKNGLVVIGVLLGMVLACYWAQGFFGRKLEEYLRKKKLEKEKKI